MQVNKHIKQDWNSNLARNRRKLKCMITMCFKLQKEIVVQYLKRFQHEKSTHLLIELIVKKRTGFFFYLERGKNVNNEIFGAEAIFGNNN